MVHSQYNQPLTAIQLNRMMFDSVIGFSIKC